MSATSLPQQTLQLLTSKLRTFFWCSSASKGLPLIAWSKVTSPTLEGGLGLRDLSTLNKAMTMKNLWALVSGSQAVWVKVISAKYFPRSSVWATTRTNKCSNLWRAMMDMRQHLSPHVKWQLGDGRVCRAFQQPWFDLWRHTDTGSAAQRRLTVSDFIEPSSSSWRTETLIEHFGFHIALFISLTVKVPAGENTRSDRLIFCYAGNGKFSLKLAYRLLSSTRSQSRVPAEPLWKIVWKCKGLIPRVRLFLWKGMHNSIPVGDVINLRLTGRLQPCRVCGADTESIAHLLFKCPRARQMWFLSALSIKSEALPDNFSQIIGLMHNALEESAFTSFVHTLWSYWKLICKEFFEGCKFSPSQVHSMASSFDKTSLLSGLLPIQLPSDSTRENYKINCFVDGSFADDSAGWANLLFSENELIEYSLDYGAATSALCAELKALIHAMHIMQEKGMESCLLLLDCLLLVNVLNGSTAPENCDWRLYDDLLHALHLFKSQQSWGCTHIPREENYQVDLLAKFARRNRINYTGFTFPLFPLM
ncbi:hypothetical protein LUZ61_020388 [Rhynchospora tenuis]|uniref:RNase H type-1 domain-containing protein n=1 Tax=Rhynchospora tenuis TaxID=198213 RepID=A0AAD5ZCZ5_9POAL|nr:hypothetical protein LUZ61_020388 [Rhynchospora tenuis]